MDEHDDGGWSAETEFHPLYHMALGSDMQDRFAEYWDRQRAEAEASRWGLPEMRFGPDIHD